MRISLFGQIRPEFQCLGGQSKISNVWKDKVRIQSLDGSGKTSKVCKDKD